MFWKEDTCMYIWKEKYMIDNRLFDYLKDNYIRVYRKYLNPND